MDLLKKLGIHPENGGASCGEGTWLRCEKSNQAIISQNPSTGEEIARVIGCSHAQYEEVVAKAHARFLHGVKSLPPNEVNWYVPSVKNFVAIKIA